MQDQRSSPSLFHCVCGKPPINRTVLLSCHLANSRGTATEPAETTTYIYAQYSPPSPPPALPSSEEAGPTVHSYGSYIEQLCWWGR